MSKKIPITYNVEKLLKIFLVIDYFLRKNFQQKKTFFCREIYFQLMEFLPSLLIINFSIEHDIRYIGAAKKHVMYNITNYSLTQDVMKTLHNSNIYF